MLHQKRWPPWWEVMPPTTSYSLLSDLWTACKDLKGCKEFIKAEAPILQPTYVRLVCWLMRSPWQILVCSEAWDVLTMSCYWFPTRYFLLSLLHLSWRLYDSCRGTQPHYYPPDPPGNPPIHQPNYYYTINSTITQPRPSHLVVATGCCSTPLSRIPKCHFGPCEKWTSQMFWPQLRKCFCGLVW